MKHRLSLDFTQKAWNRLNDLVSKRETTKAETVRSALAILAVAMDSDDGSVRVKTDGKITRILVCE